MGAIKPYTYTKTQENLAKIAKSLGHLGRINLLQEQGNRQSCLCGLLAGTIELALFTISQHLKEIKQDEIIKERINYFRTSCCLSFEKLNELILCTNKFKILLLLNFK